MQSSSDSSIWRSLAVAFGDGLAFGVGVKLSQNAARQIDAVKRIERTPAPVAEGKSGLDQRVLETIVNALDARLKEQAGMLDRRLADLDAKLTLEMKELDDQDHSIAAQVTKDLNALEGQLIAVNREFGASVAGIVAEQVRVQVGAHAAAAERDLEKRIARAVNTAVEQHLALALRERIEPMELQLREEISRKEREIAELRKQLADSDTNLLDIVSGIGQVCRQAAERMTVARVPVSQPEAEPEPKAREFIEPLQVIEVEPGIEEPFDASPLPGFAQPQKPNRLWRVPLVSSLVVLATGGVFLIRYL